MVLPTYWGGFRRYPGFSHVRQLPHVHTHFHESIAHYVGFQWDPDYRCHVLC